MAGRIRDEDIAQVRERARIEEVVRDYVTLKSAGGGSLKGLCPFHDEKTPSFNVNPGRGYFHCFGCQEGGDVFAFVMKIDHLGFTEAVEKLAARTGVDLRYVEGGTATGRDRGLRARLVEAHKVAAQFYAENLTTDAARIGREFLTERGFDREAAERFGVGFAPAGWDGLTNNLRARGFSDDELLRGGLVAQRDKDRGVYDRFRGRLVWPIRDLGGDVVGFGARRLTDDDQGPKYLNTPETPIYKKSQVLYGLELAKREIARQQRAVVVEGYTDVMACHLAGVDTAVATCGTAFGVDHIKVLRRLLMDQNELRGEVVFCFDGDAAGQKAALKAFEDDQRFVTQTFVAVEPHGLDPCDLRLQHGDDAVRDLVARRVPLFEFAIRSRLKGYDLETPEGRINGLRAAAPAVASIKDRSLRPEYTRLLAGWLGLEIGPVRDEVGKAERDARSRAGAPQERPADAATSTRPEGATMPPPGYPDPAVQVEREALKVALQWPALVGPAFDTVPATAFTVPAFAEIQESIIKAGGVGAGKVGEPWIAAVRDAVPDDRVRAHATALAVEPLRVDGEGDEQRYVSSIISRLRELDTTRQIAALKSKLQRVNPVEQVDEYNRLFGELLGLEQARRALREQAIGDL
jgi:DNA primase